MPGSTCVTAALACRSRSARSIWRTIPSSAPRSDRTLRTSSRRKRQRVIWVGGLSYQTARTCSILPLSWAATSASKIASALSVNSIAAVRRPPHLLSATPTPPLVYHQDRRGGDRPRAPPIRRRCACHRQRTALHLGGLRRARPEQQPGRLC